MLSASEIADLEKKVYAYRLKAQLRYVSFIVLFMILASSGIFFYTYSNKITIFKSNVAATSSEKNTTDALSTVWPIDKNTSLALSQMASQAKEETSPEAPPLIQTPLVPKAEPTLMLKSPNVHTGNEVKKSFFSAETPNTYTIKKEFSQKEVMDSPSEVLAPPSSKENLFYRSTEENIDTTVLAPPNLEEIKPKGMIKIESKEVNSIEYLKDKFEKTSNIIFALMLAEEYYTNKNYSESNKWALIANHIDADNEKSWLWFAKSKVKLGQKEDAIVALKAFLKTNKSQAAQTLLNKINVGELNE